MSEIDRLRDHVDENTMEMIKLLKSRTDLVRDIGKLKQDMGMEVADRGREGQLREKVRELCCELGMETAVGTKLLDFLIRESIKTQSESRTPFVHIFTRAKALEEQGRSIIRMEVGEPDFAPDELVRNSMAEAFDLGYRGYGTPKGMPQLRDGLSKYATTHFGARITRDHIMVTPGARFGCHLAMSLLDPGDEVVMIEPVWSAYKAIAQDLGMKPAPIHTSLRDRWEPTPDMIQEAADAGARMLVLNYPNNPTGRVLPRRVQDKIVDIAASKDMYILSDEIYRQYAGEGQKSILEYDYEKSIVVQSFSKAYSMTGFRVGYAMARPHIIDIMSRRQSTLLTSVAEPMQYAAMRALETDTSDHIRMIASRLDVMSRKAKEMGLDFVKPDGGLYLFVRTGVDGELLSQRLLDRGVAVAPGWYFGNYNKYIRLSACRDEGILIKGMNTIQGVLESRT